MLGVSGPAFACDVEQGQAVPHVADEQEPEAAHRATNEALATARVNRKAALAAADWALRSGASLEVLRDILSALGIDAEAVSPETVISETIIPETVIPVITLP